MATTSPTDSERRSFVPEAVRHILAADAEDDCVTVRYEGGEGPFHIQVANFPDGRWLTVCNYPGGRTPLRKALFGNVDPHPYRQRIEAETDLEIDDTGNGYVVLDVSNRSADTIIADVRETAQILGADIGTEQHVKSETIHPDSWRNRLLDKVWGAD